MKGWMIWVKVVVIFFIILLLSFSFSFTYLFPASSVRLWVNTMEVPGEVSASSVHLNPLMRLKLTGVIWKPHKNPFLDSVNLKRVIFYPSWKMMAMGKKALSASTTIGGSPIVGSLQMGKKITHLSVTTLRGVNFPLPLNLHKGITLKGVWRLKADLSIDKSMEHGGISGSGLFQMGKISFGWMVSPLGPLNLTFAKGIVGVTIDRSVLDINRIDFKGGDLDVNGTAMIWMDPITGNLRLKGTIYIRPKIGLATSNSRLDAAIHVLPKDTQGFRLSF